ncbi:uncharacterized protein LOC116298076 [Actinia tenebrosa]|uniref:Uncharacterized protein LOC116298076 n=1 Tax=Actinia tenebrosa TaxID=6105 RepID=A0A6P8I4A4_ACTTE|nr:uncharacterized protein LOC116298076 [Actinia tenebrosa]
MSVRRMHRRDHNTRVGDHIEASLGIDRSFLGPTNKNRLAVSTAAKDARLAEPIDQGSNLHMAIKLLKAENSNLEKIIILLKAENQKVHKKMRELEYQNDRYKITQNQLKNELKRERDMVKYLHGISKKHERTIQKKDAEYRQLKREAREHDRPREKTPDLPEKLDRNNTTTPPDLPPKQENASEKPNEVQNRLNDDYIQTLINDPPHSALDNSFKEKARPQPPKRSDSFNVKRNGSRPFVIQRGEKSKANASNAYNSDSALTEAYSDISSLPRSKSTDSMAKNKEAKDRTLNKTSAEEDTSEWDDVSDVLGFLNEKVNQFERLLVESGGSTSNSSCETIEPGK